MLPSRRNPSSFYFPPLPKKSCTWDALSPLCHLTARAFALCHLIPARCQCRIPSNRSRIHSAWHPAASCCHSPFPPGTSWVPACPRSPLGSRHGRASLAGAAGPWQGREGDAAAHLSRPHRAALAPKPRARRAGERKKARRGHPHLCIHLQPPARVRDPRFGCRASWGTSTAPAPGLVPSPSGGSRFAGTGHRLQETQKRSRGRRASPGRPVSILRQSLASSFLRQNVSSSGPHQRPSLSNPSESRRKPPRASTAIPCPSDTGTAGGDHRPPLVPYDGFQNQPEETGRG